MPLTCKLGCLPPVASSKCLAVGCVQHLHTPTTHDCCVDRSWLCVCYSHLLTPPLAHPLPPLGLLKFSVCFAVDFRYVFDRNLHFPPALSHFFLNFNVFCICLAQIPRGFGGLRLVGGLTSLSLCEKVSSTSTRPFSFSLSEKLL